MRWSIYYSNTHVSGETEEEWNAAPDSDVQVLVLHQPYKVRPLRFAGFNGKCQLITGDDTYTIKDPYSKEEKYWKIKYGKWMDSSEYFGLWEDLKEILKDG